MNYYITLDYMIFKQIYIIRVWYRKCALYMCLVVAEEEEVVVAVLACFRRTKIVSRVRNFLYCALEQNKC